MSSYLLSEGDSIRDDISNRVGVIVQAPSKGSTLPYLVRFSDGLNPESALVKPESAIKADQAEGPSLSISPLSLGLLPVDSAVSVLSSGRKGVISQAPLKTNMPYLVRFSDGLQPDSALFNAEQMTCTKTPEQPSSPNEPKANGTPPGEEDTEGTTTESAAMLGLFKGGTILDEATGRVGVIEAMPSSAKLPYNVRFVDGREPATGFIWPYHAKAAPDGAANVQSVIRNGVITTIGQDATGALWQQLPGNGGAMWSNSLPTVYSNGAVGAARLVTGTLASGSLPVQRFSSGSPVRRSVSASAMPPAPQISMPGNMSLAPQQLQGLVSQPASVSIAGTGYIPSPAAASFGVVPGSASLPQPLSIQQSPAFAAMPSNLGAPASVSVPQPMPFQQSPAFAAMPSNLGATYGAPAYGAPMVQAPVGRMESMPPMASMPQMIAAPTVQLAAVAPRPDQTPLRYSVPEEYGPKGLLCL